MIDEFRSKQMGLDAYRDFEYLAYEMYRMKLERDPGFHSHQGFPMEVYERAFPDLVSGSQ